MLRKTQSDRDRVQARYDDTCTTHVRHMYTRYSMRISTTHWQCMYNRFSMRISTTHVQHTIRCPCILMRIVDSESCQSRKAFYKCICENQDSSCDAERSSCRRSSAMFQTQNICARTRPQFGTAILCLNWKRWSVSCSFEGVLAWGKKWRVIG